MKKPEDTNSIGNLTIDILKLIGFDDGLLAKAVEGSLQTLKVADAQLAKLKTYQTVVRELSANPSEHHKLERIVLKVDTDRFLFPIVKQLKFDDIEKDTDSTKLAKIYLEKIKAIGAYFKEELRTKNNPGSPYDDVVTAMKKINNQASLQCVNTMIKLMNSSENKTKIIDNIEQNRLIRKESILATKPTYAGLLDECLKMPLLTTGRITPASLTALAQDFKKIQAFIDYTADPNHINQPRSDRARSLEVTNINDIITKVSAQLARISESAPDKNLLEVGKKILADLNHNKELYKKGASVSVDGTSERNAQTQESANTQSKIATQPARPQWTRRQSLTAEQVVEQIEKAENREKIGASVATGPK